MSDENALLAAINAYPPEALASHPAAHRQELHDLNNLLTVIYGYSDLILAQALPDDPNRAMLEQIHAAAERAARLTRKISERG